MMSADTKGVAMDSEKGIVASQWCALLYAMVSANAKGVAMDSEEGHCYNTMVCFVIWLQSNMKELHS